MNPWNSSLLILDDEKDILEAYEGFLAPRAAGAGRRSSRTAAPDGTSTAVSGGFAGYKILKASSGEQAIELVKQHLASGQKLAGGFFDVKLGGMDGIQTLQEIWKLDPQLHATVVTAYHDRSVDDMDQLFGENFKDQWDYLNKPFTQAEIVQKARQMCASWNRRQQLIHAERMAVIGQLSRSVGHEFGNILQAILGKAELGMMDTDPEKAKERFEAIFQAANRASMVVKNLQSVTKESQQRTMISLKKVIEDTLSLMNHELGKNSIRLNQQLQDCTPLLGTAAELEQVFLNLLMNAKHALSEGGVIEVGCQDRDGTIVAWVKDSGTGIPAAVLPRIFEYAFTTKEEKGSGLGLSISKEIVENHGGTLSVESEFGRGSCFTLSFQKKST